MLLETLLGRCVSGCLHNKHSGQSAMNHFLLDVPKDNSENDIGRYGTTATNYIISKLFSRDANPAHYRAQIFGGAEVLKTGKRDFEVGQRNISIARECLRYFRIPLFRMEVGGNRGRRIVYNTQ
jgi:chemotaxis protein CheD